MHRKRRILIISVLVATPKRCQNLKQNLKRWIALLRKAFRLRPPIGSPSVLYCMGRNVRHTEDGSFSSSNQPMSEFIQTISQVTEEVRQGTHTSNREKDVLTQALGTKEHPGRTRGIGIVPWKLAFSQESNTYRSRSRGRADQEAEYLRRLKEMEERMAAWIEATVEA